MMWGSKGFVARKGHAQYLVSLSALVLLTVGGCVRPEQPQQEVQPPPPEAPAEQAQPSPPPLAKLKLQLVKGPQGIVLTPDSKLSMEVGENQQFKSVALDVNQQKREDVTVIWASENPDVATVDPQGSITAVAPGETTITAFADGRSASVRIVVIPPKIAKLSIKAPATTMVIGENLQLELIGLDTKNREHKNTTAKWNSNNVLVAQINISGLVTAVNPGSATLTATAEGKTASAQVTVTAPPAPKAEVRLKEEPPKEKKPLVPSQLKEDLKAKFKGVEPSELLYLSGITGEMAGKGDSSSVAGEAEQAGLAKHPLALEMADLPKDQYGLVDWAAAIKTGRVKPRHSTDPKVSREEPPLDLDVVIFTKSRSQPDVVFPHKVHTMWLDCGNCHDEIFKRKAGGHPEMTMPKIAAGQYCGRCHNRVAFPLSDCLRCHVKPKDQPPLDPNPQFRPATATPPP